MLSKKITCKLNKMQPRNSKNLIIRLKHMLRSNSPSILIFTLVCATVCQGSLVSGRKELHPKGNLNGEQSDRLADQSTNDTKSDTKDHLAQEQRIAVQIITTDGFGAGGSTSQVEVANRSGGPPNDGSDRKLESHESRTGATRESGVSFDEQYGQLEKAYERGIGGPRMRELERKMSQNSAQKQQKALPKRIVINLGSLATEVDGKEEKFAHSTQPGGAKLTIGFQDLEEPKASNSAMEKRSSERRREQQASKLAVRKNDGGQSAGKQTASSKQRPVTFRRAVVEALSEQGGVPAMVMNDEEMEDVLAEGGENDRQSAGNKARPKLMLDAEMIDMVRRARKAQPRHEGGQQVVKDSQENGAQSIIEPQVDEVRPYRESMRAKGNERYQMWPDASEQLQETNPSQRQRETASRNHTERAQPATRAGPITKPSTSQEANMRNSKKQDAGDKTSTSSRLSPGLSSRSARSSDNDGAQGRQNGGPRQRESPTTSQPPGNRQKKGRLASEPTTSTARSMDERVARLLDRLKLYTTKDQLIKVARDLQSTPEVPTPTQGGAEKEGDDSEGGQINLDEFQSHRMQFAPMEAVEEGVDVGPSPVMLATADSDHNPHQLGRMNRLVRNRVPSPIRDQTSAHEGTEASGEHYRPIGRTDEQANLFHQEDQQDHQDPDQSDLSSEGSERESELNGDRPVTGDHQFRSEDPNTKPIRRPISREQEEAEMDDRNQEAARRPEPIDWQSSSSRGRLVGGPTSQVHDDGLVENDPGTMYNEHDRLGRQETDMDENEDQATIDEPRQPAESTENYGQLQDQTEANDSGPLTKSPGNHGGESPEQEIRALEQVIDELIEREKRDRRMQRKREDQTQEQGSEMAPYAGSIVKTNGRDEGEQSGELVEDNSRQNQFYD